MPYIDDNDTHVNSNRSEDEERVHLCTVIEQRERMVRRKRYNLVVVGMFKNEISILREWLDHNIAIGVEHFYLIDNGSTDGCSTILYPYMHRGIVTLVTDPRRWSHGAGSYIQPGVYYDPKRSRYVSAQNRYHNTQSILLNAHFLRLVKEQADWVLIIDIDEYIFSPLGAVSDVLRTLPNECTDIWTPWRIFGSSGHDRQPPSVRKGFLHMRSHEDHLRGSVTSVTIPLCM